MVDLATRRVRQYARGMRGQSWAAAAVGLVALLAVGASAQQPVLSDIDRILDLPERERSAEQRAAVADAARRVWQESVRSEPPPARTRGRARGRSARPPTGAETIVVEGGTRFRCARLGARVHCTNAPVETEITVVHDPTTTACGDLLAEEIQLSTRVDQLTPVWGDPAPPDSPRGIELRVIARRRELLRVALALCSDDAWAAYERALAAAGDRCARTTTRAQQWMVASRYDPMRAAPAIAIRDRCYTLADANPSATSDDLIAMLIAEDAATRASDGRQAPGAPTP